MKLLRWLSAGALGIALLGIPSALPAQVAVGISVRIGPPALPVYAQPVCPGEGYIWVPGYWAYADGGYYWVPGTWVIPPEAGLLWTPGYWGFGENVYVWHPGYWGPHVGFYGGIDYGYGYPGTGFYGGYWNGGRFFYNRSVTNVNVTVVRNVYERRVVEEHGSRASFNGRGGATARPTREEQNAERERHFQATAAQQQHRDAASRDRSMFARDNNGRPPIAATPRPGELRGNEVNRPADRHNRNDRPPNANQPENRPNVNNRPTAGPPEANRPNHRPNARPNERPNEPDSHPNHRPPANRPNNTQERPRPDNPRPNQAHPNQARPQQNRPHPDNPRSDQARPRPAPRDNHQPAHERPNQNQQKPPHPDRPNHR